MDGMYGYMPAGGSAQADIKAAKRHFAMLGGMFTVGTAVIYAVQIMVSIAVDLLKPEWLWNPDAVLLISALPLYIVGMPVMILLVKLVPAGKVERRQMKAGEFVLSLIMCFCLMYLFNIIGNIVTVIIGMLKGSPVENVLADVTDSVSPWLLVAVTVVCAPIFEEYIFRKLIVDRTARYGEGIAVMLSGLMFGLFHGNLNQFAYAFALGIFLAYLYVKTGNLKITIAIHMVVNIMGGVVGILVTDAMDPDAYADVLLSGNSAALRDYVASHLGGLIAYLALMGFMFGTIITGLILFIVFLAKRKFVLRPGSPGLPKGKKFRTCILNVGMIAYFLFWIIMIIVQLFM